MFVVFGWRWGGGGVEKKGDDVVIAWENGIPCHPRRGREYEDGKEKGRKRESCGCYILQEENRYIVVLQVEN